MITVSITTQRARHTVKFTDKKTAEKVYREKIDEALKKAKKIAIRLKEDSKTIAFFQIGNF